MEIPRSALVEPWKVQNGRAEDLQIGDYYDYVVLADNFQSLEWNNIKTVELSSMWFQLHFYDSSALRSAASSRSRLF